MYWPYIFGGVSLAIAVIVLLADILKKRFPDGTMVINRTDPEKDYYRFIVHQPLETLHQRRYLTVRVKIDHELISEVENSSNKQSL